MTRPDPSRPFLQDLASDDWAVVREGIRQGSDWLQGETGSDTEVAEVGQRLVELTHHPKWEVRRAVALAIEYLKHHSFQLAIAPLLEDTHHTVQVAAQRSLDRWTEAAHTDVLSTQHGELLQAWLGDIEMRHGPKTREAAMRLAERYSAMLVKEAGHEFKRVFESLDYSLVALRTQVAKPRLDRKVLDEGLRKHHETLKVLQGIMEGLKSFTANVTPVYRVEHLRMIVVRAVDQVRNQLGPDAHTFAVELGIDPDLCLEAHYGRLRQAFENLILNAFQSYEGMSGQRRLVVAAREEPGNRVSISFVDRGCGMSETARHQAFQLFTTTKLNGTGFGLPLVKKIIKNEHKGAITLESKKGEGTTVTVVLPIDQKDGRR